MKNLLSIDGAQKLSKIEQLSINGGSHPCKGDARGACYYICGGCRAGVPQPGGGCECF